MALERGPNLKNSHYQKQKLTSTLLSEYLLLGKPELREEIKKFELFQRYTLLKKARSYFVVENKPMLKVQGFIQLYTYCIMSSSVHINSVLGLDPFFIKPQ